jgi:hypothetical protein
MMIKIVTKSSAFFNLRNLEGYEIRMFIGMRRRKENCCYCENPPPLLDTTRQEMKAITFYGIFFFEGEK